MVITVRGTVESDNHAPQGVAALAFESAYAFSLKTLVLQFTSKTPVEELLIGRGKEYAYGIAEEDDTGIETLLRKAAGKKITSEHFSMYTKAILTSQDTANNFDVAQPPRLVDFKREITTREQDIKDLVQAAKEVYDNIFLLCDGNHAELINILAEQADVNVVCVGQCEKQEIAGSCGNVVYIVTDFDTRSTFNEQVMKKHYESKKVFPLPYNVSFRDAYLSRSVMKFMVSNYKAGQDDANGAFIKALVKITNFVLGVKGNCSDDGMIWHIRKTGESIPAERAIMREVSVETRKKRFFKKEKVVIVSGEEPTVDLPEEEGTTEEAFLLDIFSEERMDNETDADEPESVQNSVSNQDTLEEKLSIEELLAMDA